MFYLKEVKYRDILFIDELKINSQQVTCIVGKSGGGKTTFLKLLNNMISQDSGIIKFQGKEIEEYDPVELRRKVLMLPQNPVVFPGTIEDNFNLALQFADREKSEDKFEAVLDKVQLNDFSLQDKADNLSGGEKQRLALARILLLNPEILLLDEPSSALDENTEELIIQMVVDFINEKDKTLVMVTHSKSIAEKYGEKIVTINQGKLENIYQKEGQING